MKSLFAATALAGLALSTAPAGAQEAADSATAQTVAGETTENVRMVIVYGDDAAPEAVGDEIVVVARLPESDRYRIPESLRFSDDPENVSWTRRV